MTKASRPTPWPQVVHLRPELRSGELTLADFAADLHEVVQAEGKRPTYEDPAKFFALTFPTHALRGLVRDVADRLAGRSDKAVRQLELTYGGGKTHTLITLHHLFRKPGSLPDLAAVREFREAVGRSLPQAFVASLCFDKIDVEKGIEGVRAPDGGRRTLRHPWSILAWQLAGAEGLESLHADGLPEERDTPPAEPLLANLISLPLERGLGTLILVDEVLMYARLKVGMAPVWRNRIQDFFQYLVQAVSKVDRAAIVASLLATDPARQSDEAGKQLIADLFNVFRRTKEEGVQPVAKEDVAEVLRRRFFVPEDVEEAGRLRPHVIATVRELGRLDADFKKRGKAEEERFAASYPFHPDLTEIFYSRWTQLEGFQRTRGILRTLAIGLREAEDWDECPVIGPAVLLGKPGATSAAPALSDLTTVATAEDTKGKRTEWKQLLEAELKRARQVQGEMSSLAVRREIEQAVVTVFLHSQPIGQKAHTPELRRLIGTGSPDRIELDKGLSRWRDISWFLDDEDGVSSEASDTEALPTTWRLGNRPNLRQMHEEAIRQRVSAERVGRRLTAAIGEAKLLTAGAKDAGARVYRLPKGPADVKDDATFGFVVLGPEAASDSGKPSSFSKRFLAETTGSDRPRVHRNALVLAAPSRDGLESARAAVRNLIGWEEVDSQLANLGEGRSVDLVRKQRLRTALKQTRSRVSEVVLSAYCIVVTMNEEAQGQAFKLPVAAGALFPRIQNDKRSRIQDTALEPAALLPGGPYDLWKEGETSRRVAELANAFARYPRLPKLLKPGVVRDTVIRGVEEGLLVARLPRPDKSFRTFWRQNVGPEALKDPSLEVVLPDTAELTSLDPEMLAPSKATGSSSSGDLFAAGTDRSGDGLPGLWDAESVELSAIERYFGGEHTVLIPKDGFEETLPIPECSPEIVRAAAVEAVEGGLLWLVNGPTSLWKEPVPDGALGPSAEFRPRPEPIQAQKLLPESQPQAWQDDVTNGAALNRALSQEAGKNLPWGLVRESIRAAATGRWIEIASGAVDCGFDLAGSLKLRRPAPPVPSPTPDPPDRPEPSGAAASGWAVLDSREMGRTSRTCSLTWGLSAPGTGLRFRLRLELRDAIQREARDDLNRALAKVSPDLHLE